LRGKTRGERRTEVLGLLYFSGVPGNAGFVKLEYRKRERFPSSVFWGHGTVEDFATIKTPRKQNSAFRVYVPGTRRERRI